MQLSSLHSENLDEGLGKTLGTLGLATMMGAGAMGLYNKSEHKQSQPTSASQKQSNDKIQFNFGGPRKCSVELTIHDDGGSGQMRFLTGKMDKNVNDLAGKFINMSILKAADMKHGDVTGVQKEVSKDGNWATVNFTWDSVE